MSEKYHSIADEVHALNCAPGVVEGLTTDELAALHAYRQDCVNDLKKLYTAWGEVKADDFIRPLMHKLSRLTE
ncbi:MAG TPA: hypothetical protein VE309_11035 [Caulobacteraceae bacterium]|jgi:hypothetical protein|nr:hypothetical protein [Caulobacteraceae bacterium]